jgi:hypothetical protein
MALRSVARNLRFLQLGGLNRAFGAHAPGPKEDVEIVHYTPTVFDKIVPFFVIDKDGVKHSIKGLEGQRMAQAMVDSDMFPQSCFMPHLMQKWMPDVHVYVADEDVEKLPTELGHDWPLGGEDWARWYYMYAMRNFVQDYAQPNSFLGHYIVLGPQHKDMTVAIAPLRPWIIDDRRGPSEDWMQKIPSHSIHDSNRF